MAGYFFRYVVPKVAKNLTKLRKIKDEGFKSVDDQTKGTNVTNQKKAEIKKSFGKKVTDIINPVKKAKGGRVGLKGGTNLGMQSVKYGLDNKPEVTKLDRIAKFIAKDKKKKNKKFKTPMDQAVKKDKKNKRFV